MHRGLYLLLSLEDLNNFRRPLDGISGPGRAVAPLNASDRAIVARTICLCGVKDGVRSGPNEVSGIPDAIDVIVRPKSAGSARLRSPSAAAGCRSASAGSAECLPPTRGAERTRR